MPLTWLTPKDTVFRILLLTAHDPNDLAHGMGLVVSNTFRELSRISGVQVNIGMLLANGQQRRITPPPELEVNLTGAVIAERRDFDPRRERFRCLFHQSPSRDCKRFLSRVQSESRRADAVVWFGYFWDSVSYWLPQFCSTPVTFHPNDSLSLSEASKKAHQNIMGPVRVCWATWQERRLLKSGYRAIVYSSKADAAHAQSLIGDNTSPSIAGLENGVDTVRFSPGPHRTEKPKDRAACLFVGRLDYPPNIEAVKAIITSILPKLPLNVQVWIAGASPVQKVRECCRRLPDRIRLLPDVPNIADLYRSADVFLAPIVGKGGIKNKILEAAACGISIVTTSDGVSGIGTALPGVIVSRNISDMANGVIALLARDPLTRDADSVALRNCVLKHFTWTGRSLNLLSFLSGDFRVLGPDEVN